MCCACALHGQRYAASFISPADLSTSRFMVMNTLFHIPGLPASPLCIYEPKQAALGAASLPFQRTRTPSALAHLCFLCLACVCVVCVVCVLCVCVVCVVCVVCCVLCVVCCVLCVCVLRVVCVVCRVVCLWCVMCGVCNVCVYNPM